MLEPIKHILSKQRIILASTSPRRREILESVGLKCTVMPSSFEENLDKDSFSHPCEYVKENAKQKALDVWRRIAGPTPIIKEKRNSTGSNAAAGGGDAASASAEASQEDEDDPRPDLVIGADTVVTLDDEIIEKPKDAEDAERMLRRLSGRKHIVYTGVALVTKHDDDDSLLESSAASLSSSGPTSIVSTHEPIDHLVTTFHEGTEVHITELPDSIIKSYVATGEPLDKAGAYGIQGIGGTIVEGIKGDYFNVVGLPLHRLCKEIYYMLTDKD